MNIKKLVIILALASVISLFGFVKVIWSINLAESFWPALALFYLSFFLSVFGLASLFNFLWLVKIKKVNDLYLKIFKQSIKNGLWFGLVVVLALILQSQRLLNWAVFLSLLMVFVFGKIFFFNNAKK